MCKDIIKTLKFVCFESKISIQKYIKIFLAKDKKIYKNIQKYTKMQLVRFQVFETNMLYKNHCEGSGG